MALREALAYDQPCTVVLTNRRRDGSEFLNELSVVPIRDAQGRVVQHLGVLNDVTERVRRSACASAKTSTARWPPRSAMACSSSAPTAASSRNPSACEMPLPVRPSAA